MTLADDVSLHIRAAFSGIWVQSQEPEDAIRELQQMCASRPNRDWIMGQWDAQNGLTGPRELMEDEFVASGQDTRTNKYWTNPIALLGSLPDMAQSVDKNCFVLVLNNFHRIIDELPPVQYLANAIEQGKAGVARKVSSQATDDSNINFYVVVLAPVVKVPVELDRRFVIIEHKLPDKTQLLETIKGVVHEDELPQDSTQTRAVLEAASGLTRFEVEGAAALSVLRTVDPETKLGRLDPKIIWGIKAQMLKKRGLLELYEGNASFDNMGGMDYFREFSTRLLDTIDDDPLLYPKGLLLLGVPGSGKTEAVRCLGNATNRRVLHMRMGSLRSKYVGESDQNLDQALQIADAMAPCILFVD